MADILILDNEDKKNSKWNRPKKVDDRDLMTKINEYLLSNQWLKVKEKVLFFSYCLLWLILELL